MAERQRSIIDRLLRRRASPADAQRMTDLINGNMGTQGEIGWDGKTLASLSKIGMATNIGRQSSSGSDTAVSYHLLREISLKSEVVNAIIRRAVDDTLANGYQFDLADGKLEGSQEQLDKIREFFRNPNPDDMGDEWLESLLFDLILFGDGYVELDGSADKSSENGQDWVFGGDLLAVWTIPAETMKLVPANQTPKPPKMAYIQDIDKTMRKFDANKVIHVAKFKQGRGYGSSPLIPLMEIIAGQLNLSNYLNMLYTGTLPKTILNVGDISNTEMKAMLGLIEQQLSGGKSPFGLIAINGGTGFNLHRLIDSTREGAQLDLLYYYREEICAVFGIPPMKLGWVQTGKMANPEQQLDAWYDVVESYHARLSSMMNNRILPKLGITDWKFKFVSIRPSRETERAETLKAQASAVAILRQEAAITINEAREMLGFTVIKNERADDPFFISPKLSINTPNDRPDEPEDSGSETDIGLDELFPNPMAEEEEEEVGEMPKFSEPDSEVTYSAEQLQDIKKKITDASRTQYDRIFRSTERNTEKKLMKNQEEFADRLLDKYSERLNPNDLFEMSLDNVSTSTADMHGVITKAVGADDLVWMIDLLDRELQELLDKQTVSTSTALTAGFDETLATMASSSGVGISFDFRDAEAMKYWNARWRVPALKNTLGVFRKEILTVFESALADNKNWQWVQREMRKNIDPTGKAFPRYYYNRIARTETRRVVANSHLSGLKKLGFRQVKRIVVVDSVTDKDLCSPFENAVYPIDKSGGVVPAHPNCRCVFVPYEPSDEISPITPVPDSQILKPDVEGAEILDLE
tara:strand:+ start:223 stop:2652 length:2430 start_codon:yes stop_codon:yes gene_type:complete